MSENTFTPGPWTAHYGWGSESLSEPDPVHPKWCEVTGGGFELSLTGHVGIANARLAAAAPDLFGELQKIVSSAEQAAFEDWLSKVCPSGDAESVHRQWQESFSFLDFAEEWKSARDAIAKARDDS